MLEGIGDESIGIDFGDKRLNKRSKHIREAPADEPEASIDAACNGWGDTVAAPPGSLRNRFAKRIFATREGIERFVAQR